MKKKIIIVVAVILVIAAVLTGVLTYKPYAKDKADTEELYRQNVSAVGYENTIETAIPQTELYTAIHDHFFSPLENGKTEKKAIILGYDGCRADILAEIDEANSGIAALVNDGASLELLYCGGVNYPAVNTQDTSTAPGWCSILTGVWADVHGITGNDITKTMDTKTLLTSLVEEKLADSSAFITKWKGHFSRRNATYLDEMAYCENNSLPVSFTLSKGDEDSHALTLGEIRKADCADFIFVIYEPTDGTGHGKGFSFNNPEYKEAFRTEDAYALEAINAIKARPTYEKEDWLIVITSDHGGIGTNHGKQSIQERMTFAAVL
ncbi:MAG: alkaline phosphatase family protein [Ruminococcaceae bacterium]|nr:alkaline phosphatase family protein [Oscillospiraceae bacterium]